MKRYDTIFGSPLVKGLEIFSCRVSYKNISMLLCSLCVSHCVLSLNTLEKLYSYRSKVFNSMLLVLYLFYQCYIGLATRELPEIRWVA